MLAALTEFLIMLNPFALFLYLLPVMRELSDAEFRKVLFNASLISLMIFLIFLFTGDRLFEGVFHIDFESFRVFGGIVIFSFAYLFIVKGQVALIQIKGSLDNLASEIALPFMVGAGTILLTILMGHNLTGWQGVGVLLMVLTFNFLFIIGLKYVRDGIRRPKWKVAFDKNMEILLRLNGFFLGAIGVEMIMSGLKHFFFKN